MNLEVLSPAGDYERLMAALNYGADAVYLGRERFGMRASPQNFDFDGLKEAVRISHERGVKVYLTCNTLPRNNEIPHFQRYVEEAVECGVDALIAADIGIISLIKKYAPQMEVHASTQTGIVNYVTARELYDMGCKRVVLARELSIDEIAEIRAKTPKEMDIEAFVHGAMCVSFSGRCLLSSYLVNRDANRGECAQPCRWGYHLMEEKRPNEFYPVFEDEQGTYILNAKDMCMIDYIDRLHEAGIYSLKIEGRAKSAYYVSVVTNAYRMALDFFEKEGKDAILSEAIVNELSKASHRPFTTGFFNGKNADALQETSHAGYIQDAMICATVEEYDADNKVAHVFQRNRFFVNDTLEILSPCDIGRTFSVEWIKDAEGNALECAPHPKQELYIGCSEPLKKGDILKMSGEIKRY